MASRKVESLGPAQHDQRMDHDLRKQSELFRITLASIGDAVVSTDGEGRITFMNGVAENLTGWPQAEAAGQFIGDVMCLVHESTREPIDNPALQALREGTVVGLANHTALVARDGREVLVEDSAAPIRDDGGRIVGAVLVFRDVTERKKAEVAQARLAAIVESSQDAIVSKTLDGIIESWNAGAERLFGYAAYEVIGKHITIIIPQERLSEEADIISRIVRGERVEHFETIRVTKYGKPVHISLTISPVRDRNGAIVGASKIARDISDRIRAEEALRDADRRKDQFIALLAHELRNPLAPLRNGLQVMRLAGADADAVADARDMMERQLGHMVRLIDDLLDISRISQNKMELRRGRVLLADIINSAVETARPILEVAGHRFHLELPTQPITLNGDFTRLAQVFSNLLNNSAKYTGPGGHVWLGAEILGDHVLITVRDNGIGIPAEALPRIFDMFSQVNRSVERNTGGLGIGLALVKGLVEMHGGTVSAFSAGQGKGSTFTVALPFLAPATVPAVTATDAIQPGSGPKRRILVVDDNRDGATSMAMMLKLTGNEVYTAHDGLEAIASAEKVRPQVILMDMGMPRLDGFEATQRIRAQAWGKSIVIVALTGWGQERDKLRSQDAGCDAHLVKPIDFVDLDKVLSKLCAGKSLVKGP